LEKPVEEAVKNTLSEVNSEDTKLQ